MSKFEICVFSSLLMRDIFFSCRIDSSGDGQIDFEEFVEVMSRKVNATYSAEQVKGAFKVFEGNSPGGCVRSDALIRFERRYPHALQLITRRALCTYGADKLTYDQAVDLVSQLETDNAGLIHYMEYVNMMMSS